MAKWFNKEDEGQNNSDPGKEVEAKFTSLESAVTELKNNVVTKQDFETVAEAVKALNAREAKKQAEIEAEAERKRKEVEAAGNDPEAAFNQFAADPKGFVQNAITPAAKAGLLALSRQARQDVLGDKEYYTGEFKKKVNALIESGTNDYNQMSNPAYILNCYRLVLAEYLENDKLQELKKQRTLHDLEGSGSGASADTNAKPKVEFRDSAQFPAAKARMAMAQLGLKDEDIIAAAESGTIHGLEVVR